MFKAEMKVNIECSFVLSTRQRFRLIVYDFTVQINLWMFQIVTSTDYAKLI